jgi:surface polysaccharide O-acyltransferase-like enzyme
MPAIDSESSIRIRLLGFPLIIGVAYIHAYPTTIGYAGVTLGSDANNYLTDFVRILISQGVARISVPLFFLLSGYLFFAGFKWSWRGYGMKLATRVRTLLVPYLFWTILGVAIDYIGQSIPAVSTYFTGSGPLVADYSAFRLANAVLGMTSAPESYHFWFIRDLILLMILIPVITVILRYAALPFFALVFITWITSKWPIYTPDAVGVLFFSVGCYLAMKGRSLFALDRYGAWFLVAYIPILLADTVWNNAAFNTCLHRCGIVVGLVAVLYVTRWVLACERLKNALLWLSGSSFFVYAAHEPLLGIVRTIAFRFIPLDWPYMILSLYLLLPMTVIAFLVGLNRLLTAIAPRALTIVTGGRS